jgi:hypothetical protein
MLTKRVVVIFATLVLAGSAYAQNNQLTQLSAQLASEAVGYSEASYSDYRRSSPVGNVESVMAAQQFGAGAQLFNRMINDRRRTTELREAFQILQSSWRSSNNSNYQRNRVNAIERLLADIGRNLNFNDSSNNNPFPRPWPDGNNNQWERSGRMTWKGRVDDLVRISIRGSNAEVETLGGNPFYDAVTSFTAPLSRRANVTLNVRKGRGEIWIEQQPSRENDYTAVVRIRDQKGGASDYEFELSW